MASVWSCLRRLGHAILAIPQELRVGPDRDVDHLALEARRLEHGVEDVLGGRRADLIRHREDPAGVGELAGPDDVHADEVDGVVLGAQAAHELLAGLAGVGGQELEADGVAPAGLLGAVRGDLLEGASGLVLDEPRELARPTLAAAPARDERRGGGREQERRD